MDALNQAAILAKWETQGQISYLKSVGQSKKDIFWSTIIEKDTKLPVQSGQQHSSLFLIKLE